MQLRKRLVYNNKKNRLIDVNVKIHEVLATKSNKKQLFVVNYIIDHTRFSAYDNWLSEFYALKDEWEQEIKNNIQDSFGEEQEFDKKWQITIEKCRINLNGSISNNYTAYVTIKFYLIYVADILPGGEDYQRAQLKYDDYTKRVRKNKD